jgi:signal transduction histidine kinase
MQPDLSRIRWTLTRRYALISSLVLVVFGAGVYLQVAEARQALLRTQLQQLASAAASQMPLILHELGEYATTQPERRQSELAELGVLDNGSITASSKRIRWLNADLVELSHYGQFVPAGGNPLPQQHRDQRQFVPLANGLSYWRPVLLRDSASAPPRLAGYVSVAVSSMAADLELRRLRHGLLAGGLAAALTAVVLSQWMVASSLRPIREQIQRLVQFTADASHELRHPLTAIRAVIGSLRAGDQWPADRPPLARKLEQIDRAAAQMGQLVDDLLLLARLDRAAADRSHWLHFDLSELLDDLVDLQQERARAAQLYLALELSGPAMVQGEPGRLRQLLSNLLANALQFSPAGSTIQLGLQRQAKQLLVWVEDQGPGIPADQREQVFERFWQADRSRHGSQTGLGLAIARGIATAHGGSLRAVEGAQGGCRMELLLPAA